MLGEMLAMCVAVAAGYVGAGGDNYRGVRRSMEQWRHGARDAASPWWPPTDPATLSAKVYNVLLRSTRARPASLKFY